MTTYVDVLIFTISGFYVLDLLFSINPDDVYIMGQKFIFFSHEGLFPAAANNIFLQMSWAVVRLIIGDLGYYVYHWLMHNVKSLWFFHAVHHSATSLNLLTAYRLHPVDGFFSNLIIGIAGAFYAVLTMILFGKHSLQYLIFGFVFYMPFRAVIANLRHSQVWWRFPNWLSHLIMSPAQHQIHHSKDPKYFNLNYANDFAFYDHFFGTLYVPTEKDYDELRVGIDEKEHNLDPGSFWSCMWQPFVNLYQHWKSIIKSWFAKPNPVSVSSVDEVKVIPKSS